LDSLRWNLFTQVQVPDLTLLFRGRQDARRMTGSRKKMYSDQDMLHAWFDTIKIIDVIYVGAFLNVNLLVEKFDLGYS